MEHLSHYATTENLIYGNNNDVTSRIFFITFNVLIQIIQSLTLQSMTSTKILLVYAAPSTLVLQASALLAPALPALPFPLPLRRLVLLCNTVERTDHKGLLENRYRSVYQ